MKIGEIAEQARVSTSIIRYYEGKGILPRAVRDSAGYRDYGDRDLARIRLAMGARHLGCSFEEIESLIAIQDDPCAPSQDILDMLNHKLQEVNDELQRLNSLQAELCRLEELARRLTQEDRLEQEAAPQAE